MSKTKKIELVMDILAKYGQVTDSNKIEEPVLEISLYPLEWGKLAGEIVEALCSNS